MNCIINKGNHFFIEDSLLGYKLDTGIYYIPLDDESIFIATNDKWGYRNQIGNKEASNIHFYGCSVTYGICVEDDEVFSEVLNRISPNNHFFNFGVPSYSMVQSYLQFKNNLETGFVPEKAFFITAHFTINERSAMSNTWVKNFSRKNFDFEVPYINKNTEENYNVKYKKLAYNYRGGGDFSSVINFIDDKINASQNAEVDLLTVPLFQKIIEYAEEYSVDVMVCTLTNDEPTNKLKDFLVSKNIKVIDFSEIWYDVTYSCHPKDNHPNHKAHKAFADSIFQYIRY